MHAANYVVDGAHSPAESRYYAQMFLPMNRGGRGLPRPILNARVEIPPDFRALAGKRYFIADFLFPKQALAIEFDGGYHWTGDNRLNDNVRDLIFLRQGI